MADIKYEIVKEIAVLSEKASGWTKEINLVSWNGRDAKYDIREWAPGHENVKGNNPNRRRNEYNLRSLKIRTNKWLIYIYMIKC